MTRSHLSLRGVCLKEVLQTGSHFLARINHLDDYACFIGPHAQVHISAARGSLEG